MEEEAIMGWLIDTAILIDHFRGTRKATAFLSKTRKEERLWISLISIAEIFAGRKMSEAVKNRKVRRLLRTFRTAYLDIKIAVLAGEISRDYEVLLPDALIAATALRKDLTLASRNLNDFSRVPHLKVHSPY